jgi:hypothetical protein
MAEIKGARLTLTDADLAVLVGRFTQAMQAADAAHAASAASAGATGGLESIEDLKGTFRPSGVLVEGRYAVGMGVRVGFEANWTLGASGSATLTADLQSLKVAGVPAALLERAILRKIEEAVRELGLAGAVTVDDQQGYVAVDAREVARHYSGLAPEMAFRRVGLGAGECVVEFV